MKKTVLITGTSSGIGKETAVYFADMGWNVVATMRNPEKRETPLKGMQGVELLHLDVLDNDSIAKAVTHTLEKYGKLDVLVNNAGYATQGVFEASTPKQVENQFNTNVFGLMEVTRAVLPHFRKNRSGIIINVASVGGRVAFPLYSIYNSTKWAVEGFSECLAYELKEYNIKVKIIEPGIIKTDFYNRSMDIMEKEGLTAYDDFVARAKKANEDTKETGSYPRVVAEGVYKAATDGKWKLRYHMGKYSGTVLTLRKLLPDGMFFGAVRKFMLG